MKKKVKYPLIHRGRTNNGDLCKQKVKIMGKDKSELALIIYKYVLTSDIDVYRDDFKTMKIFKGKTLFLQVMAIRLTTLQIINNWLNDLYDEKR